MNPEPSNSSSAAIADPSAYQFQMALIAAIEAHVRALRYSQFRALHYRGADFARVISVELYFRLINDNELRLAFDRYRAGDSLPLHPDEVPISTVANWAFEHMRSTWKNPLLTRAGAKHYLYDLFVRFSPFGRAASPNAGPARKAPAEVRGPVAFLALSLRFYKYLQPIAERLAEPVTWIVPENANWVEQIAGDPQNIARFPHSADRMPQEPVHGPIGNWISALRRYDDFCDLLHKIAAPVVVLVEGNHAEDELLALAARSFGARSICIQQGWSPVVHNGFRKMQFDLFCVWGKEFSRMLKPFNPHQRFDVTGSHIVTPLAHKQNPQARDISIFLQKDSLLISNAAWLAMLDFITWCSSTWPDRQILVREHPAIPLDEQELAMIRQQPNIRLCRAQDMSLTEVLDRSEVSVAIFSTTLIEAVGRHVIPLIVNVTGAPRYCPDLEALGVGVEVKSFEQAKTAMTYLLEGKTGHMLQHMPTAMNGFFAADNTAALDNMTALIKKIRYQRYL